MELINDSRIEKVEAGNLLEDFWFFGNLLQTKTKMSRCYSDPRPSSNHNQEMFVGKPLGGKSSSAKKQPKSETDSVHPKLARAPSMRTSMARGEEVITQEKESHFEERNLNIQSSSRNNLVRAPSLPVWIGNEDEEEDDDEDQESEFTISRLIRQASLNSSNMLSPRQTSKSSIVPRPYRPLPRKAEKPENIIMEAGHKYLNERKLGRNTSVLQTEEVQGSRDLGIESEKGGGESEEEKVRRPYINEPWHVESSVPTVPKWGNHGKRSPQDMKAQIKFWARAVASNARAPGVLITNQN